MYGPKLSEHMWEVLGNQVNGGRLSSLRHCTLMSPGACQVHPVFSPATRQAHGLPRRVGTGLSGLCPGWDGGSGQGWAAAVGAIGAQVTRALQHRCAQSPWCWP